jgi:hypothetical protein
MRLARRRLVRPCGWVRRRGRIDAAAWIDTAAWTDAADVLRVARGLLSCHLFYRNQLAVCFLPGPLAFLARGDGDLVAGPTLVDRATQQLAGDQQQELVVREARLRLALQLSDCLAEGRVGLGGN